MGRRGGRACFSVHGGRREWQGWRESAPGEVGVADLGLEEDAGGGDAARRAAARRGDVAGAVVEERVPLVDAIRAPGRRVCPGAEPWISASCSTSTGATFGSASDPTGLPGGRPGGVAVRQRRVAVADARAEGVDDPGGIVAYGGDGRLRVPERHEVVGGRGIGATADTDGCEIRRGVGHRHRGGGENGRGRDGRNRYAGKGHHIGSRKGRALVREQGAGSACVHPRGHTGWPGVASCQNWPVESETAVPRCLGRRSPPPGPLRRGSGRASISASIHRRRTPPRFPACASAPT